MSCIEIPLNHGHVALIDEEDQEVVRPYAWFSWERGFNVYAGCNVYMHRLIAGAQPGLVVDHKNGNGLDNRRENLRICTREENRRNARKTHGISRYKGVQLSGYPGRPWQANIGFKKKNIFLGSYPTEIEAARAYNAAALEFFGEFARLNEIEGLSYEESIAAPERNRNPGRRSTHTG